MNPTIDDKQLMGVEKSVRFEENVLFRPIEHQRDLTAEHRDQLWYNVSNIELCALGRTGKMTDILPSWRSLCLRQHDTHLSLSLSLSLTHTHTLLILLSYFPPLQPKLSQDDDFERIKSDIRNDVKTARRMRRTPSQAQNESVCTLGIEHLLSANTLRSRIESKHVVIDAVLDEQERVHRFRMMDRPPVDTVVIPSFITIAQASMVASLRHRQNAVDRAN